MLGTQPFVLNTSFGGYEYAEKVTFRLSFVGRLSSFVTDESVHLEARREAVVLPLIQFTHVSSNNITPP